MSYEKKNSGHINSLKVGDDYMNFVIKQMKLKRKLTLTPYTTMEEQYSIGETKEGYEIKADFTSVRTNRLSIEYKERKNPMSPWVLSGIMRKDNTIYYVQGNYEKFWVFDVNQLRDLYSKRDINGNWIHERHIEDTLMGFYLTFEEADKYCLYFIKLKAKK